MRNGLGRRGVAAPRRGSGAATVAALLLGVAALACSISPTAAQPAPVQVRNPAELLAAINGGTAAAIHLMEPMVLPEGWGPARVARPLLIMSPYRVVLDWCDAECRVSTAASFVAALLAWRPHVPPDCMQRTVL